ncbi:MAG: DUF4199 domain-containing protein [Flavobacteriaceae bacterium]|nr:DUF4199 domain-containing protein [Flavobacteriaceae bacterium]
MKNRARYYKYGMYIGISLVIYFLLMRIMGFHQYLLLSLVNGLILAVGIYLVMRNEYKSKKEDYKYVDGINAGLATGVISTVFFTIFMALYLYQFDHTAFNDMMHSWQLTTNGGEAAFLGTIFLMGIVSVAMVTLMIGQRFKPSWNVRRKSLNTESA